MKSSNIDTLKRSIKQSSLLAIILIAALLMLTAIASVLFDVIDERCEVTDGCLLDYYVAWSEDDLPTSSFEEKQVMDVIACPSSSYTSSGCRPAVLISGNLAKGVADHYLKVQKRTGHNLVCVDSPGGLTRETKIIGQYIIDNGLDTCMSKFYFHKVSGEYKAVPNLHYQCSSSCPFILFSGKKRVLYAVTIPLMLLHREGRYSHTFKVGGNKYLFHVKEIDDYKKADSQWYELATYNALSDSHSKKFVDFYRFAIKAPFIKHHRANKDEMIKYQLFNSLKGE